MITWPNFKKCPCCNAVNFFQSNKGEYMNKFKSLENWTLKKLFTCRKCGEVSGLFINKSNYQEKSFWVKDIKIDESYFSELKRLEERKNKLNKILNHKYYETLGEIKSIQDKIRLSKVKLKVKFKIKKKFRIVEKSY